MMTTEHTEETKTATELTVVIARATEGIVRILPHGTPWTVDAKTFPQQAFLTPAGK